MVDQQSSYPWKAILGFVQQKIEYPESKRIQLLPNGQSIQIPKHHIRSQRTSQLRYSVRLELQRPLSYLLCFGEVSQWVLGTGLRHRTSHGECYLIPKRLRVHGLQKKARRKDPACLPEGDQDGNRGGCSVVVWLEGASVRLPQVPLMDENLRTPTRW